MALEALPLEDFARGVFHGGADESWYAEEHHERHEPSVIKRVTAFRKIAKISQVMLQVYSGPEKEGGAIIWRHLYPLARLIMSGENKSLQFASSVTWTAPMLQKPFAVRLPSWLTPVEFRYQVRIEAKRWERLEIDMRTGDVDRGVPISLWLPDGDCEGYLLRVHA